MSQYLTFANALAASKNQPTATYDGLCSLADQLVGVKLFTLTMIDNARREARRVYSNMPEAYPVLGIKPMRDDPWSRQVLQRHEVFVANDIEAIAEVFPDFDLIQSLGCESVVNVPIVVAGKILGTVNCLHEANFYTAEKVQLAESLRVTGALALLINHSQMFKGKQNG